MKFHQLRALIAIADSGSIHEAAKVLHISQPALSKSVKELEADLGVPLLVRSNRGITITPYGERLLGRARLILGETRRARDDLESLRGSLHGRVAIGVSPVTPSKAFVQCIQRYRRRHPAIQLQISELRPAHLLAGMREGALDLVLTSQPPHRSMEGFEWRKLYEQGTVLAVRQGHPQAGARRLEALMDEEWLVPDSLDISLAGVMFRNNGLPMPQRVIECSSLMLYAEMAMTLGAVSFWSQRTFVESMQARNMQALDLVDPIPSTDISLVYRPSALMTPPAQILVDDLLDAYRNASAR
ncbi:LysR family transcriptional regulator [Pseudomonas xanthosomatis]|uniref:LysR family transcriptional regulator n=1 Tax=Pseudomonas xanthosomatis TaxID=2842356 RepID=UPI00351377ED